MGGGGITDIKCSQTSGPQDKSGPRYILFSPQDTFL